MSEFRLDDLISDEKSFQLLQQERAIVGVAELICQIMERQGVTQKELARRLQKLPSHISQILGGEGNLTLRTIADIFTALGQSLRFDCGSILPVGNADGYPSSLEFEWKADQSRANYWADQTQGSGFSCRRPELAS